MSKSYALTGHTSGIGRYMFDVLPSGTLGFSKSAGYDITVPKDRRKILKECSTVDVFINNAQQEYAQTELLFELAYLWKKDSTKTIISVGSRITEIDLPERLSHLQGYKLEKVLLKRASLSIEVSPNYTCKTLYKSLGFVGTQNILKMYPHFTKSDYIPVKEAGDYILRIE